jgi:hypothetical protein
MVNKYDSSGFKGLVFAVNSELELPDSKQNKPRPRTEQAPEGFEKRPLSLDGCDKKSRRGSLW